MSEVVSGRLVLHFDDAKFFQCKKCKRNFRIYSKAITHLEEKHKILSDRNSANIKWILKKEVGKKTSEYLKKEIEALLPKPTAKDCLPYMRYAFAAIRPFSKQKARSLNWRDEIELNIRRWFHSLSRKEQEKILKQKVSDLK